MSKVLIIIIAIIVVVAGSVGGFLLVANRDKFSSPQSNNFLNSNSLATPAPTEEEVAYEDSSGISFRHVVSVTVQDVTPDDDTYYTSLALKGKGVDVVVSAMDTTYKTVDAWLKATPDYSQAKVTGAASLGGVGATQYKNSGKLLTVAIDQGIVYIIEAAADPQSEAVYDLVVQSFTFGKAPAAASGSGGGNVIYEEEEVVE